MFDRLNNLIDVKKLSKYKMLIVGVGGVGSAAFEVLVRSGCTNITIADYDAYEESNLNRQLASSINTIGQKKVDVLEKYAKSINKNIIINKIDKYIDNSFEINKGDYDYIIDACDSIETKVYLILKANELNIPIISACGAGNRLKPLNFNVCYLDSVIGDPLAKKLKNELKKVNFNKKVYVVASSELPIKQSPVSSYIAASLTCGVLLADKVIKDLLERK